MKAILRTAAAGLALASLGIASSASAATDTANAEAEILAALTLTVQSGDDLLDFGLIADNGAGGTVDVAAGTDIPVCNGDLVCSGTGASPNFDLVGQSGLTVNISFTDPTPTITSGANSMIYALSSSAGSVVLAGVGGAATGTFDVGGTLTVDPGQPAGVYTGTFAVVALYN